MRVSLTFRVSFDVLLVAWLFVFLVAWAVAIEAFVTIAELAGPWPFAIGAGLAMSAHRRQSDAEAVREQRVPIARRR